jgi:ABC-type uncharacterized transport system substrate-binding protein
LKIVLPDTLRHDGLNKCGHPIVRWIEAQTDIAIVGGQNVAIEYRSADGQLDRLPALATDLVRRDATVIASLAGVPSARAAQAATATIPVVFTGGFDPVELGLVASLARPGGNITGVTSLNVELARVEKLGALAARRAVPTIHQSRELAAAGGLVSYSASSADAFHLVGVCIGRILKGEKPAELPVQQSTKSRDDHEP